MECCDAIFADPLACDIAYFLVWANFSRNQFWTPYCIDSTRGHEMINEFTAFLNDERVVLASQLQIKRN
jgi:mannan endo-1,4-beta-mannosidase